MTSLFHYSSLLFTHLFFPLSPLPPPHLSSILYWFWYLLVTLWRGHSVETIRNKECPRFPTIFTLICFNTTYHWISRTHTGTYMSTFGTPNSCLFVFSKWDTICASSPGFLSDSCWLQYSLKSWWKWWPHAWGGKESLVSWTCAIGCYMLPPKKRWQSASGRR